MSHLNGIPVRLTAVAAGNGTHPAAEAEPVPAASR
jgi:hypothetical protein